MEHYNDNDDSTGIGPLSGNRSEGRPSLETSRGQHARLRKRATHAGSRGESQGQSLSSPISKGNGVVAVGGFGEGGRTRKGSIRNAVRKIFGRRSREVTSPGSSDAPEAPASRHTYHRSEPMGLPTPQELPELTNVPNHEVVQPAFSDPYPIPSSPPFNRTASSYAVQFPNSVRLKPMDLGNPFMPTAANAALRRRKTLSSLIRDERRAATMTASATKARESFDLVRPDEPEIIRDPNGHIPERTSDQVKKSRRKSRSTDDLKSLTTLDTSPVRKRSEEIRYWRDSFQPDVLRTSVFTTKSGPREKIDEEPESSYPSQSLQPGGMEEEEEEDDTMPLSKTADPLSPTFTALSQPGTFRSSPPIRHGGGISIGDSDIRPSSSAIGTEMAQDLEDRVAKLEAGLQNFQRSLQRLTADRNRRTVIMGSITARRSSTDLRTPSLLAETLADPLAPSSYQYEYEHTSLRPATSPHISQQQPQLSHPLSRPERILDDPFGLPEVPKVPDIPDLSPASASGSVPAPPSSSYEQQHQPGGLFSHPSPLSSHPPMQQPPLPGSGGSVPRSPPLPVPLPSPSQQQQPHNFGLLYQMLSDERSARKKLENQLRGLRREISDLHLQVNNSTTYSSSSNVQSTRNSYMLAGSSARLQELLAETESSSPVTHHHHHIASSTPLAAHDSPRYDAHEGGGSGLAAGIGALQIVTSRFSGSESEANATDYDDLATPHEAYRTPREERSAYSLASQERAARGGNEGGTKDNDNDEGEMF